MDIDFVDARGATQLTMKTLGAEELKGWVLDCNGAFADDTRGLGRLAVIAFVGLAIWLFNYLSRGG